MMIILTPIPVALHTRNSSLQLLQENLKSQYCNVTNAVLPKQMPLPRSTSEAEHKV